ncbi:S9 family peptidase [Candidatus Uhrbacteria bacterium]|nr:S9 family peptidase [Candidatus Uhrbacteria bacterium]
MHITPFGLWSSPLTPALAAKASASKVEMHFDGDRLYWIEKRPVEEGRYVIVREGPDGTPEDVLPAPWSAFASAHYGGGAMAVDEGELFFLHKKDGRVYSYNPLRDDTPVPITQEAPDHLYADLTLDRPRRRLIAVRENHVGATKNVDATTEIVTINLADGTVTPLVSGADFYAAPRLSPSGKEIAWIQWHHPHMPWGATQLCRGKLQTDGTIRQSGIIVDGEGLHPESILEPSWSPGGMLHFISDITGWWNIYAWSRGTIKNPADPICGEHTRPPWAFGLSHYGFCNGVIFAACRRSEGWAVDSITPRARYSTKALPLSEVSEVRTSNTRVAILGGSPTRPQTIYVGPPGGPLHSIGETAPVPEAYLSTPEAIEFKTTGDNRAFGFFYPPKNPEHQAPEGTQPPLIVTSHGGPTSAASLSFNAIIQFWTSRGFAVLDVDYRGSSNHGRQYRERLNGMWGIYDVDDCIAGARHLIVEGRVDKDRVAIRGQSASGFTVLAALTTTDFFKAGVVHFGICDLTTLNDDTHKFEARYLFGLVPEDEWRTRSPIYAVDHLRCPMLICQGLEDTAVPPSQAEKMVAALEHRGVPCTYITFAEEGHGFVDAKNITRALEEELAFYCRVFGITP